jgi:hypothetical protein
MKDKLYSSKVVSTLESILIGYNCISNIDMYSTVTIPLAVLLNKLNIKKEIVGNDKIQYIDKKVLTNTSTSLSLGTLLSSLGIPSTVSTPIINVILELLNTDIDREYKLMQSADVGFKGYKLSECKKVLKHMQYDKIALSTIIVIILSTLAVKTSYSLVLVNLLTRLTEMLNAQYKLKVKKTSTIL